MKHPTKKPGRGRKVSEKQVRFSDTPKRPKPLTESRVRAIVREELGKTKPAKGPSEAEVEELAKVMRLKYAKKLPYNVADWNDLPESNCTGWKEAARAALKWFAERGSK